MWYIYIYYIIVFRILRHLLLSDIKDGVFLPLTGRGINHLKTYENIVLHSEPIKVNMNGITNDINRSKTKILGTLLTKQY